MLPRVKNWPIFFSDDGSTFLMDAPVVQAVAAMGVKFAQATNFVLNMFSTRENAMRKLLKNKKGQGLVEYGILVGGIALVALAATAILGHKTTDLIGTVAAALPGAHDDDEGPIISGKLVKTTTVLGEDNVTALTLDASGSGSFSANLGINATGAVIEP